jgi:D-glycero-D-manno-heptose 1,7-bisphosphate phosphatase
VEPAIFLDRDNTLIVNEGDLGDPKRVLLCAGVPEGLRALRKTGYRLVVVTNQAGVARGKFTEADVDAVHQRIAHLVDDAARSRSLIDRFYYCPYHPEGTVDEYQRDHPWRKPHPGMLIQAAHDMGLDLGRSWMIGDMDRDVAAGRSAGCRTVLISTNGEQSKTARPTAVVSNFAQAVDVILRSGAVEHTQTMDDLTSESDRETLVESIPESSPESIPKAPRATARPKARAGGSDPTPVNRSESGGGAGGGAGGGEPSNQVDLRRAILDLADELRTDRQRRGEFTFLKMAAGLCQLLVVLLAMLGLLQLADAASFFRWMLGAILAQLLTIALLLLDSRS